ncbi:hypothetical protein A2U01_0059643 [Trifolium medium]|uniref:Uncharacterized protein n=1 Tax=Trifolium medium TaxID=97028 RepID=A0A392RS49_9FABA|nr:hypothetical protein [Trifolium medium]
MGRHVLESECSRLSDDVRSEMDWSHKLWEQLEEKLLDRVFGVGTSLRLEFSEVIHGMRGVGCSRSYKLSRDE